jgi:hypothetical protein
LKVWTWKLCLFVTNHIYNNRCDSWSCQYMCEKGFTFEGLLWKRWYGQVWKDRMWNCAPCHLPHVDGQVDPLLLVIIVGLWCMLHIESWGVTTMLVCDHCSKGWYTCCITPPFVNVPIGDWVCPRAPKNHVVLC